ncbi:MBL fold metallo-hydrolase [Devriesea agamarum]|uniref:MBL fold metallo-hydrolase n=1 Tax=Devriesea agamarum TaxID=472569 RepID=UPI00071DAB67|nr:MBL fold metallo-hydrolase [Devriesea agamarum]
MYTLHQAAPGVFFAETALVNWVILRDARGVTLIDTGYPGQRDDVLASIRETGAELADLRAILITHAHVDHLGSAQFLQETYGVPVYVSAQEETNARGVEHFSLTAAGLLRRIYKPGVLPWLRKALTVGVQKKAHVSAPTILSALALKDLPGSPTAVVTPGHTPGHTCYHLAGQGVLVSGDALVTGHPIARSNGPQLLPAMFDHDREKAAAALQVIGQVDANILLPGHGSMMRITAREACQAAQRALGSTG